MHLAARTHRRRLDEWNDLVVVMERFGYPDFLTASADELAPAPSALSNSTHRICLHRVEDVDDEVREWLQRSYAANVQDGRGTVGR